MNTKSSLMGFVLILMAGVVVITFPLISAESEPNDSLDTAQPIGEESISGSVSLETDSAEADVDFYKISVPLGKDLKVKIEKHNAEVKSISVDSYDSSKTEMGITGINLYVVGLKENDTDSWFNDEGVDETIYLRVYGAGNYTLTTRITSETEDELISVLSEFCFLGTIGIICIPITIIIVIIVAILIIIKIFKKKKK
jgi:hypothetical protein